jgi:ATP-dependent protease ClpP protease subunit
MTSEEALHYGIIDQVLKFKKDEKPADSPRK